MRSVPLTSLVKAISKANQHDIAAGVSVETHLAMFYERVEEFAAELSVLKVADFAEMAPRSRETPTHYKWHLFSAVDDSFTLWLHEYKSTATRSGGYAQTIHNHRYCMSALLLRGGYCYTRYSIKGIEDGLVTTVDMLSSERIAAGATYAMDASDFHSVTEIQDRTVSLMVQWKPRSDYSISIDHRTHRVVRHYPIESRLAALRSSLAVKG